MNGTAIVTRICPRSHRAFEVRTVPYATARGHLRSVPFPFNSRHLSQPKINTFGPAYLSAPFAKPHWSVERLDQLGSAKFSPTLTGNGGGGEFHLSPAQRSRVQPVFTGLTSATLFSEAHQHQLFSGNSVAKPTGPTGHSDSHTVTEVNMCCCCWSLIPTAMAD